MQQAGLADLIAEYLAHVGATRGTHTLALRRTVLERTFLPWAAADGVAELDAVTPAALDRFSRHLQTQPGAKGRRLAADTVHTYCRELNLFLGWTAKHADGDASLRADAPPLRRRTLAVLTREEIDRLEEAASTPRDKLIVRLLADTGMRVGELLNLRPCDVVREQGRCYVSIRGKTGGRIVGIEMALYRRVHAYAVGGRTGGDDDPLFVALAATGIHRGAALTHSGVGQMLRELAHRAGIRKRVYPHLFRHSYATDYLNTVRDPVTLAKILGHSSLHMIQSVYANLAADHVHDAMLDYLKAGRKAKER